MGDATSHYRAIRYSLGPLNVVVRFEADAYYDGASDEHTQAEATATIVGLPAERPRFDYRLPFRVLQKGRIVPTAQIAELKTTAYQPEKGGQIVQCQDQLWFGRTTHLLTGKYSKETGEIVRLKYEDARPRVNIWEERNQESLRKLVALLSSLKNMVPTQRGAIRGVVLAREDKSGPLVIRTMEEKHQAVQWQFFQRHWKPRPNQQTSQRGDGGGARGPSNLSRGYGRGIDHPRRGQSSYGQPNVNQPNYGSSGYGQSGYPQPGHRQSRFEQPSYDRPNRGQPGSHQGQSAHLQQSYDQSNYGQSYQNRSGNDHIYHDRPRSNRGSMTRGRDSNYGRLDRPQF